MIYIYQKENTTPVVKLSGQCSRAHVAETARILNDEVGRKARAITPLMEIST